MIIPADVNLAVHLLETARPGAVFITCTGNHVDAVIRKATQDTYRVRLIGKHRDSFIVLHDSEAVLEVTQS